MLLYDIRLSRPVLNKFINAPFQNCLKTYDNKLVIAPKNSDSLIEVFDMRKFNQAYSILVNKCVSDESSNFIIEQYTPLFDNAEAPYNFNFKTGNFKNKLIMNKRQSKFLNLVVGLVNTD